MSGPLANRVFRAVEGRGTGLLPLLPAELVLVLVVTVFGAVTAHVFVGIGLGGAVAAALGAWRKKDHGRADYARASWRRLRAPEGRYAPHARDRRATPFEGRTR